MPIGLPQHRSTGILLISCVSEQTRPLQTSRLQSNSIVWLDADTHQPPSCGGLCYFYCQMQDSPTLNEQTHRETSHGGSKEAGIPSTRGLTLSEVWFTLMLCRDTLLLFNLTWTFFRTDLGHETCSLMIWWIVLTSHKIVIRTFKTANFPLFLFSMSRLLRSRT